MAATHTALNLLRSGRRRSAREVAADDGPTVVPDVADLVVTREERSAVRAALARLPHKQAAALVLRHSGLSYAEVAAALDLSPGSVGATVHRADAGLVGAALATSTPAVDTAAAWARLSSTAQVPARPVVVGPPRWRAAVRRPAVAALSAVVLVTGAGVAAADDWLPIFHDDQR